MFNTSSVAENIFTIHAPKNQLGMIDYKRMYRDARQILDLYGFQDVGEKATMRNLSGDPARGQAEREGTDFG